MLEVSVSKMGINAYNKDKQNHSNCIHKKIK